MKAWLLGGLLAASLGLGSGVALAHGNDGGRFDHGGYGAGMGPGMMGGYGAGMGPGMMGGYGAGMGPGMMGGYGAGMGPGMMGGYGAGMGPGMMGGYGPGMGPGMMDDDDDEAGGWYGRGMRGNPSWQRGPQGEKLRQLQRDFFKEQQPLMEKMMEQRLRLRELSLDDKADPEQAGKVYAEIFRLRRQMQENARQMHEQLYQMMEQNQQDQSP
ncbi:periplasmic heavy metal sensor [Modicisalibacter tunisiensis]|uniref:Zinc resistance-associated protein n=1 Tax=Modicisalibacter tunisiensis TaxID=390637 RepID=A0ABS7WWV7_9GAMM|nr:periplasmic heavy metal sensor [Modicisalibacter tunisiensis]MBZ9567093.1 hypothetical protein [Modicisalibacter tunisiensis]